MPCEPTTVTVGAWQIAAMRITIVMYIILGGEGITGEKTAGAGPRIIVDRIKAMMITVAGGRIIVDRIKATITVGGARTMAFMDGSRQGSHIWML
jgi:hypothetical protein